MTRKLTLLAVLLLFAAPAWSTSYVMMSDEHLADTSPLIAEVSVINVASSPAGGAPATDYIVLLSRMLKGDIAGSAVVVRVPGGERPNGIGLKIYGAPTFSAGDRAILFLSPAGDGTFRIRHLMLGAFHEFNHRGRQLAVRDLSEAQRVGRDRYAERDQPRDFERFATWLADRSLGRLRDADYFEEASGGGSSLRSVGQAFTLLRGGGKKLRWFEFDDGAPVEWFMHQDGHNGRGGGRKNFRNAMAVWNDDPATQIELEYVAKTSASAGFSTFDGVNALLFKDPNNDIGETFSCFGGGTLAIGGPWFDTAVRRQWKGGNFVVIQGADIVTARGTECYFDNQPLRREEVWAHELGHTLGLGHSCGDDESGSCNTAAKDDALMRAFAHDDGRGALLGSDDFKGIDRLYGSGRGGGGGGGGGPTGALDAPSNVRLKLRDGGTTVRVRWDDNSSDETEFVIQRSALGGGFSKIGTVETDVTRFDDPGIAPGIYSYRVRAKGEAGRSKFSDEVTIVVP